MTSSPRPVYFDCDTGVDDALALAYLLASPEIDLVGIGTVSGNISADGAARNTLGLLALADRTDIPVAVGASDPIAGEFDGGALHVHGANGLGGIELPEIDAAPVDETAAAMLIRLSHEYSGELEVLAVGPFTNLAIALAEDETLPSRVKQVTVMGGAALVPGNISPVAEANVGNDPEAADAVMLARWPVVVVPLDVTMEHIFEESHLAQLRASGMPIAVAVADALDFYFDFYTASYGRRASALHDPLAAALMIGTVQATNAPAVPVRVDATNGPGRGQMIADLRDQRLGPVDQLGAHVRVVLATDRSVADELVARITAP